MAVYTFNNLKDCARAIKRDSTARNRRLRKAVRQAAVEVREYVADNTVPRAHQELADSIHVEHQSGNSYVVADAPHAAAVENGSRPHWVPIDALVAWVQLRGMQGLTKSGMLARSRRRDVLNESQLNSVEQARTIGKAVRKLVGRKGAATWRAFAAEGPLAQRETGVDPVTRAIANAIRFKIAKQGTRPSKYMLKGVDRATRYLDEFVKLALPDP